MWNKQYTITNEVNDFSFRNHSLSLYILNCFEEKHFFFIFVVFRHQGASRDIFPMDAKIGISYIVSFITAYGLAISGAMAPVIIDLVPFEYFDLSTRKATPPYEWTSDLEYPLIIPTIYYNWHASISPYTTPHNIAHSDTSRDGSIIIKRQWKHVP